MPAAISNIMNSGAQIGNGSPIAWLLTGATIVPGDFIVGTISTHGTTPPGDGIISCTATFTVGSTGIDWSGTMWAGVNRIKESPTRITSIGPMVGWPEEGLSVYVYLQFIHAFAEVCHDQTIGFVWNHAAGIGNLVALAFDQLRGVTTDTAAILAAIQRTPTVPGQR